MALDATLTKDINAYVREHSGLEDRNYVGMSQISRCPRELYHAIVDGRQFDERLYRMTYVGYLFERDALRRLVDMDLVQLPAGGAAILSQFELVAPFDSRFRGHIDGQLRDGRLLEIKSVGPNRWEKVFDEGRPLLEHFEQVQCYLRYGHFPAAVVIYVNRDTFEHRAYEVGCHEPVGRRLEAKAKRVLAAVDARKEPACECHRCERKEQRS